MMRKYMVFKVIKGKINFELTKSGTKRIKYKQPQSEYLRILAVKV